MYEPLQDGIDKSSGPVIYREVRPPQALSELVHCYWQLKTENSLDDDFTLHAIPDACINILLNQRDTDIAGITGLKITYAELNLGKSFDYAGIQFFPGVWQGDRNETQDRFVGTRYEGPLPLVEMNRETAHLAFEDKCPVFTRFISCFAEQGVIAQNATVQKILTHIDAINSVAEMSERVHHSPRQLQRILKQATGFSPHDFLKVMRLQQSLKAHHIDLYTDQSHFIRSFKKITGYTPTDYFCKYNV